MILGWSDLTIGQWAAMTVDEWSETKEVLEGAGLIANGDICKWDKRQYKSDCSTARVKRFRNVTETPSESETETDTEGEKSPTPKIKWAKDLCRKHHISIPEHPDHGWADKIIDTYKDAKVATGARVPKEFPKDDELTAEEWEEAKRALAQIRGVANG